MISRWNVVLISSLVLLARPGNAYGGEVVGTVSFNGAAVFSRNELGEGSLLGRGAVFSDSLLDLELARIDSLYFSQGWLGAAYTVDTFRSRTSVDVEIAISEGERSVVGTVSITGAPESGIREIRDILGVDEGRAFEPLVIEASMMELLRRYNDGGYPYAQVWLTGFEYRPVENEVDLAFSVFEGKHASISSIMFDGLAKTDSSLAARMTGLRAGEPYNEGAVERARQRLGTAWFFESVGEPRVEAGRGGAVDIVFPVKERTRYNMFQGAFGFSRRDDGTNVLNGSVDISLRNIAGKGRDVFLSWLNDGEKYSRVDLKYTELFFFSLPFHLDANVRQVVHDSLYTWHSAGLIFRVPVGARYSILAGVSGDRNVPDTGELLRSVRQRYRAGIVREGGKRIGLSLHVEGAYKINYLKGNRSENDGQFLYRFEGSLAIPAFGWQVMFWRLVSESVFSSGEIQPAERFPLGGARTIRGYRENQFRGDRIAYTNLEYRFGRDGGLFIFDDVGAFYRDGEGWKVKNGVGFGLRSSSELGTVELSFGVGDRLSLEGTRIHISLTEQF